MKIRKRLNASECIAIGITPKEKSSDGNAKYYLTKKQWDDVLTLRSVTTINDEGFSVDTTSDDSFKSYCIENGIDLNRVKSAKYVNHQGQKAFNIVLDYENAPDLQITKDLILDTINSIPYKHTKKEFKPLKSTKLLRVVLSDIHIGMTPNKDGVSLYGGQWDLATIEKSFDYLIDTLQGLSNEFTELHIIDLGDYLDGYNGQTTRGGHELAQNMNNQEQFKTGVQMKIKLLDNMSQLFNRVEMHNICNDNHSGDFGYMANYTVEQIAGNRYNNVQVNNHLRFISHYSWENYTFIMTHGKDKKHAKQGFPVRLDAITQKKIDEYIKHYKLYNDFVFFEKGDSHQMVFDFATSDDFNYLNYPAMAPSSDWVQTNFKKGKSGFVIQKLTKNVNNFEPHFFNWL